ncbi:MAG: PEP-CTERM sorting domain-containing protein, partial [Microcystis panniformis]
GKMTFIDVLIATDFFSDLATSQPSGGSFTVAIPQPAGYQYAKDGYYPDSYTITYDPDQSNPYAVSLGKLTFHSAAIPEPSSGFVLLGFGAAGAVARLITYWTRKKIS